MKSLTNYGTFTTNFVESRHQNLKADMKPTHTLAECVKRIIAFQQDKQTHNQTSSLRQLLKRQYTIGETDSVKMQIRAVITPNGVEHLIKEVDLARKMSASSSVTTRLSGESIIFR